MPIAHDISGVAFKNSSVILLARVVGASGALLAPADISAASYTIYLLDAAEPDSETPVAGHAAQSLTPGTILFNSLQTDGLWDADLVGYNFKHVLDVSSHQAFAAAGLAYRIR